MINSIIISGGSLEKRQELTWQIAKDLFGFGKISSSSLQGVILLLPSRCYSQDTSGSNLLSNPDLIILKAEASLGINEIRKLTKIIQQKPFQEKIKVAFIPQAEKLTLEAQNALLKTLEEPPPKTVIILSTPLAENLLPTIISRCHVIKLPYKINKLDNKEALKQLNLIKKIFNIKKIGERILAIQPYAKDRQTAVEFCQKSITCLHNDVLTRKNLSLIKAFNQALELLQKNVNTNLVMENLVIKNF